MDKEFEEKCLTPRTVTISPTVSTIAREELIKSLAEQHKNNAEYFLEGSTILLDSSTPLLALILGYFAMEHKANQLLSLHGYKVESHICTQMALSKIVGRKDLAQGLSVIFDLRQSIGYRLFLKHGDEEKKNVQKIMNEDIMLFMKAVDGLIEENKSAGEKR